jgi:hypothetical protein
MSSRTEGVTIVIMVTHNPRRSPSAPTRLLWLRDGEVLRLDDNWTREYPRPPLPLGGTEHDDAMSEDPPPPPWARLAASEGGAS